MILRNPETGKEMDNEEVLNRSMVEFNGVGILGIIVKFITECASKDASNLIYYLKDYQDNDYLFNCYYFNSDIEFKRFNVERSIAYNSPQYFSSYEMHNYSIDPSSGNLTGTIRSPRITETRNKVINYLFAKILSTFEKHSVAQWMFNSNLYHMHFGLPDKKDAIGGIEFSASFGYERFNYLNFTIYKDKRISMHPQNNTILKLSCNSYKNFSVKIAIDNGTHVYDPDIILSGIDGFFTKFESSLYFLENIADRNELEKRMKGRECIGLR